MNQKPSPTVKRTPRRRFRLWEKKRGERQTGSTWWGSTGEVIFFTVLFLVGVFVLTELIALRVVSTEESFLTSNWFIGLCGLILLALIVTGAVGAIYSALLTATSAERRAAFAKGTTSRDLLADLHADAEEYPTVPNETNWKISPGMRLAYRLPTGSTTGTRLAFFAVFSLLWNAVVVVLAVLEFNLGGKFAGPFGRPLVGKDQPIREFVARPSADFYGWNLTTIILILFGAIGVYLIYKLFRQLVAAEAIGTTHVEVSAQPLHPGGCYRALVTQLGHLKIKVMELWLVCDEEVSFSEGTDTRIESRRIYEESVFREENIEILPSQPFQYETSLDVPIDAMHSFVSQHNAVAWKLVVKAESEKWSPLVRDFPLVMQPRKSSLAES